jgi:hypothetical protein
MSKRVEIAAALCGALLLGGGLGAAAQAETVTKS